jgi:hypothetical protein
MNLAPSPTAKRTATGWVIVLTTIGSLISTLDSLVSGGHGPRAVPPGATSSAVPRIRLVPTSDQPSAAAAQNVLDTWKE